MIVSIYQMDAKITDSVSRLETIAKESENASINGSSVVVFPELSVCGYASEVDLVEFAKAHSDSAIKQLHTISQQYGIAIVTSLPTNQSGKTYNTAVFISPTGEMISYNKRYLNGEYEKKNFKKGTSPPPVICFGSVKYGLLLGYDAEFPENVRFLAKQGTEVVLVPAAIFKGFDGEFIIKKMLPVRAFENLCFIACANHVGHDRLAVYQGYSCIVAPNGDFLVASESECSEMLDAHTITESYSDCQEYNPYLEELSADPIEF